MLFLKIPQNNSRALRLLRSRRNQIKDPNNTLATKEMTSLKILKHPNQKLPAGQTARALDDVAASLINNGFAVEAGFQPTKDAIFIEQITDSSWPYYNMSLLKRG